MASKELREGPLSKTSTRTRKTSSRTRRTSTQNRPSVIESVGSVIGEHRREVMLLVLLLGCTFAVVSLLGYTPTDPTLLHPGPGRVTNPCGPLGALIADLLFQALGYGAWLIFGGMVRTVLALAGRPPTAAGRVVAVAILIAVGLSALDLLLGPGDAFEPGGMIGLVIVSALSAVVGHVGAWLLLFGVAAITITILFQIRWNGVASRSVGASERALAWGGQHAAGAILKPASDGIAVAWSNLLESMARMGRSLVRREEELEPWDVPSELEEISDHPDAYSPASLVETTQISAPSALAEIEWVPTDDSQNTSSEVLGLFPELAPRPSAGARRSTAQFRDAPTRPSDAPSTMGSGNTPPPTGESTPVAAPPRAKRGRSSRNREATSSPDSSVVQQFSAIKPEKERKTARGSRRSRRSSASSASSVSVAPPIPTPVPPPLEEQEPSAREVALGAKVQKAAFLEQQVSDDGGALGEGGGPFELPTLSLLDPVPPQRARFDSNRLQQLAVRVEETLGSFKVTGKVTDVRVGPVVTTFEFLPDRGISVRKVSSLEDDLAMGLCALSVRIVAPIPGKGVVGIEIPSENRLNIYLREMLASDVFRQAKMVLPIVLGKDVEGAPTVADLARMPHLLVGGTTGSGKSVGVNGMLLSLLFKKTPEELRLLLIDPKKLEFKIYEDIPHLLHPVVTEPKKASAALAWCCREMDARYELLAQWDTRNIESYNKKVAKELRNWTAAKARRYAPRDWEEGMPLVRPEKLPYIVIVIDELADLMLVAKKEVEGSIARLTQMARACGIHLIVATQRPSVDVVTGLIKSNLPTRVSFKLRSGTDSRTILDTKGADALLGRGDMLYLPNAGDLTRVHGAFASDDETLRVMDYLRDQARPEYVEGVTDEGGGSDGGISDDDLDALFHDAVELVVSLGKASTSMIQRHLKIGYNRAARIVDQMEARGIVGPADGARPREVLVSGSEPR